MKVVGCRMSKPYVVDVVLTFVGVFVLRWFAGQQS
jgi:hypothetical protein